MAIVVGSVAVDVVPSVKEFTRKARAQLIPEADKLGQDIGKHIGDNIRRRLEEELKRLPNVNINADTAKFDTKIRGVKDKLDEVGRRHATPVIDANVKDSGLTAFTVRIDALDKKHVHVPIEPVVHKEELDRLKLTLDKLAADGIHPEVKPQVDSAAVRTLRGTLAELTHKVYSVPIDANDTKTIAKIARLKVRLAQLAHDVARPEIGLDGALKVDAEMAAINHELNEFGRKRETAHVNVSGVSQSEGGMRRLIDTILAIAPAAVPVAGVLTGIAGGLVGFASEAVAGLGAVGLVVKGQMSLLSNDLFTLKLDNQKLAIAQAAVDNAKGPKDRAAALKKLSAAQLQLNTDTKGFAPGERTLIGLVGQLNAKWKAFILSVVPAEVAPFKAFLRFLTPLFKLLTPLIEASFKAIAKLLNGATKALGSPLWKRFFRFLTDNAGPAIIALGKVVGNLVTGFIGLLIALQPLTKLVERGLVSITQKFADWGKTANQGSFTKFINFIKGIGPDVGKFLLAIGQAIVAIAKAAAPIGAIEVKALTSVLTTVADFATHHKTITEVAIAVFTLSRAMKALKLAALGGNILKVVAAVAALRAGGIVGLAKFVIGDKISSKITSARTAAGGGAAAAEGGAGGAAGALVPLAGAIAPLLAGAILRGLDVYLRTKFKTYGSATNYLDKKNPVGIGTGQNDVIGAAFSKTFTTVLDLFFPRKKVDKPKPPEGHGPPNIPYRPGAKVPFDPSKIDYTTGVHFTPPPGYGGTKFTVNTAAATTAILKVKQQLGLIPKDKHINLDAPGAKNTQQEIANVYLIQHHLPGSKSIKVTAPGGNLSALTLANVGRAQKNLKPISHINVSAPGATGAKASITNLLHASGLLPKSKSIKTDTPGSRASILSFINLDRQAHGLPPLKRIPTSAPGADAAVQLMITLARRAGFLPKGKQIKTDTPGAQTAIDNINTLLRRAGLLPKGKSISTSVPGAKGSILDYINLYNRAHHLPLLKQIPTSAPGAPLSIQQMIGLATKVGLVPKNHSTNIYTPGYQKAHDNVVSMKTALQNIPKSVNIAMKVIGSASDILSKGLGFAEGGPLPLRASGGTVTRPGYVRGPGTATSDDILYAPGGVPRARVSNTEYINRASAVTREGVDKFDLLNQGRATIVPRYADGGSLASILNINTSGPNVKSMEAGIKGFLNASARHIRTDQEKHFEKLFASLGAAGAGGGAGRWTPVIAQALALLHQPLALAGLFARVIAGESGGNPSAINLYDSNARAGHPSVGLAQVIRGTFEAFAGPFRNVGPFLAGVSINPLANIYAGLNYGIQTYGSVANIPGIASELHGGGYRPYAKGGPAAAGVPILVGDAGPEIFTPQTAGTVIPNGGGTVGTLPDTATIVHVYLGNREITDIVRTETERVSAGQARSLGAGRRRLR